MWQVCGQTERKICIYSTNEVQEPRNKNMNGFNELQQPRNKNMIEVQETRNKNMIDHTDLKEQRNKNTNDRNFSLAAVCVIKASQFQIDNGLPVYSALYEKWFSLKTIGELIRSQCTSDLSMTYK